MKCKSALVIALVFAVGLGFGLPANVFGEEELIPDWIKGVAGFWAEGKISDQEFLNAIEFLVNHGMIKVSTPQLPSVDIQPDQPKQETNLVSESSIDDDSFDKTSRDPLENSSTIMKIAKKWGADEISDKNYLEQHQKLINSGFIPAFEKTLREDNTSQLIPNWIKNNARWYAENNIDSYDYYQGLTYLYKTSFLNNPQSESDNVENNSNNSINSQNADLKENTVMDIQEKTKFLAKQWSDKTLTDKEYVAKVQSLINSGEINQFNGQRTNRPVSYGSEPAYIEPTVHEIHFPYTGEKRIIIEKNDIIKWINDDDKNHGITSGTRETEYDGKFLNKYSLPSGKSYSLPINVEGIFPFYCQYHAKYDNGVLIEETETLIVDVKYTKPVYAGIPTWIKDNARWWASDQIGYDSYFESLQWLYENNYLNNS